jgi:predicted nucleotidyltransferase
MKKEISDHTFLKTDDNIFFAVGGDLHTKEYIFGQPYYFPKKYLEMVLDTNIQKTISIDGNEFCKLLDIIKPEEYTNFIKENFKDYYYSPSVWPLLMKVERSKISKIFDPNIGRQQIMYKYGDQENIPLIYLLNLIRKFNKNLYDNTGVTGSLLLHKDFNQIINDVDLTIYGQNNVFLSKDFSIEMCTNNNRFSFLDGNRLNEYLDIKTRGYPGTRNQLADLSKRRWDTYFVDGTKIDLTFSSDQKNIIKSYDMTFIGERKFSGRIIDTSNSFYLPTILKVESENGIDEVMITSRGYICLFQLFDKVQIIGREYVCHEGKKRITVITGRDGSYLSKFNNE